MGLGFLAPQLVANYYNKSLEWNHGRMEAVVNFKGSVDVTSLRTTGTPPLRGTVLWSRAPKRSSSRRSWHIHSD